MCLRLRRIPCCRWPPSRTARARGASPGSCWRTSASCPPSTWSWWTSPTRRASSGRIHSDTILANHLTNIYTVFLFRWKHILSAFWLDLSKYFSACTSQYHDISNNKQQWLLVRKQQPILVTLLLVLGNPCTSTGTAGGACCPAPTWRASPPWTWASSRPASARSCRRSWRSARDSDTRPSTSCSCSSSSSPSSSWSSSTEASSRTASCSASTRTPSTPRRAKSKHLDIYLLYQHLSLRDLNIYQSR